MYCYPFNGQASNQEFLSHFRQYTGRNEVNHIKTLKCKNCHAKLKFRIEQVGNTGITQCLLWTTFKLIEVHDNDCQSRKFNQQISEAIEREQPESSNRLDGELKAKDSQDQQKSSERSNLEPVREPDSTQQLKDELRQCKEELEKVNCNFKLKSIQLEQLQKKERDFEKKDHQREQQLEEMKLKLMDEDQKREENLRQLKRYLNDKDQEREEDHVRLKDELKAERDRRHREIANLKAGYEKCKLDAKQLLAEQLAALKSDHESELSKLKSELEASKKELKEVKRRRKNDEGLERMIINQFAVGPAEQRERQNQIFTKIDLRNIKI